MLREVNGDGCQVGQPDTIRVLRAVLAELVAESQMQVCNLAEHIPFQVKHKVVGQRVAVWLVM